MDDRLGERAPRTASPRVDTQVEPLHFPNRRIISRKRPQRDASNRPPTDIAASVGTNVPTYVLDRPGLSAFALEDGVVYHTYSSYARGLDGIWSMYQWLDRAPLGRNEQGVWWRRHDEYDQR